MADEGTPADAVEQRLAERLAAAAARRQGLKEQREQLARRRTAGLKKRHAAKLARLTASAKGKDQGLSETDIKLRRAASQLTLGERRALRAQAELTAQKWQQGMPKVAEFWVALVGLLNDVDARERAGGRTAAGSPRSMAPGKEGGT